MTDKQLHAEILAELEFEPEVHPERIGVAVQGGVVSLSGHVPSLSQKLAAERVVKRVYSVKALVDELEVDLPSRDEVSDTELAEAAVRAIEGLTQLTPDTIRITVRQGHVTLEGAAEWQCQRHAAEEAVRHLRGVRGIVNRIRLEPRDPLPGICEQIRSALGRSGAAEGGVTVDWTSGRVTLTGTVSCLREREEAERAAWRALGVQEVDNRIAVAP